MHQRRDSIPDSGHDSGQYGGDRTHFLVVKDGSDSELEFLIKELLYSYEHASRRVWG